MLWLIVSAASLVGLLAIWAALSPRHWFLRAAAIGGLLGMLTVLPAFELVQISLAETASVAAPLVGLRLWRQGRFRFLLVDVFLATSIVAAAILLAKNVPEPALHAGYWAWGAACGYAVLAGRAATMLPRRRWLRGGLLASLPLAAAALSPLSWLFLWDAPTSIWYGVLPAIAAVVAVSLVLLPAASGASRTRRPAAQLSLAVLLTAMSLLPVIAFFQMVFPTPVPISRLPVPNAYIELTRIGKDLAENKPADYKPSLNAARQALGIDSLVPITYAANDVHLAPHSELRTLAQHWLSEGRSAETDGRFDDACETYLDMIRAGARTSRGGLVLEWLLSRAMFVKDGLNGIQRGRDRLSYSKSRQTCVAIRSLGAMLEPVETSIEREHIYAQYAFGWRARIRFLPVVDLDLETLKRTEAHWHALMRLLECDLSARCFERDCGTPPERLEDLVPAFLPSLPLDPYTGSNLIYRRRTGGFLLYSTGPDGVDNGGTRAASEMPSAGEDVMLESAASVHSRQTPEGT
ncbi:MAG TPA: hypothetical protein VG125_00510 [Pirellulales bacterium]|nr:hypothetical protein [Pirellulales bacterium]